jgi:hypothetical protein
MPELRYHQIRPSFHPPSIIIIHPPSSINQDSTRPSQGSCPSPGSSTTRKEKRQQKTPSDPRAHLCKSSHLTHPRPGPSRLLPLRRALRLQTKTVSKTSLHPKTHHHNNPVHPAKTTLDKTNTNLRPLPALERALALQQRRPGINHRIDAFAHNLAHSLARAFNCSFTRRRRRRASFFRTNLLSSTLGNFLRRLFGLGRGFLGSFLRIRSRFLRSTGCFLRGLLRFGSCFLRGGFFGRRGGFFLGWGLLLGYAGGFGTWAGASGFLCILFLGRGGGGLGRGGFGFFLLRGRVSMGDLVGVQVDVW